MKATFRKGIFSQKKINAPVSSKWTLINYPEDQVNFSTLKLGARRIARYEFYFLTFKCVGRNAKVNVSLKKSSSQQRNVVIWEIYPMSEVLIRK